MFYINEKLVFLNYKIRDFTIKENQRFSKLKQTLTKENQRFSKLKQNLTKEN
jgi:hypothetical protein